MTTPTGEAFTALLARVGAAAAKAGRAKPPVLVAVSKTQPPDALLAAYGAGARHFGENYVAELLEKAPTLPADIRWHFIGNLQSNKARKLVAGVPGLWVVESVDSAKLASLLNDAAGAGSGGLHRPLRVMVQVNTSGEPQKGGVEDAPSAVALVKHIKEACPHLSWAGLMTIGAAPDGVLTPTPAECFGRLVRVRDAVLAALPPPAPRPDEVELSMGMSGDWAEAIEAGSTEVRVGSAIFGARAPRAPAH